VIQAISPKLRVIGRYSILKELRRGRHSVSYAAVDPVMNRQLIVKAVELLPAGPRLTAEERSRVEQAFVRQAQAAGRLHHPHIVTVFDAGLSHAFGFLVIERVGGQLLGDLLAKGARPEFEHCASITARVADALACAHDNGVAHGHLGPYHIHVLPDGSPKVSGFGGWIDDGATGDEALAGTSRLLPYFQNEITEESRLADLRALASLLFHLVTGRAPGEGEASAAQAQGESATLAARPDTPRALARLVDAWLGRPPADAAAMRDALTAFLWEGRPGPVSPSTMGLPLAPQHEREPVHTAHIAPAHPVDGTPSMPAGDAQPDPASPEAVRSVGRPGAMDPFTFLMEQVQSAHARLRPWVDANRLPLAGVGAFLLVAMFLGVLLGNLRRPVPVEPSAPAAQEAAAESAPAPPARRVAVRFRVRPWGEIVIDGRPTGVAPPLQEAELAEGYHVVEIRHSDHPAWVARIEVHAGEPLLIEHDFP
jgi:serine/threonine-protein kinase